MSLLAKAAQGKGGPDAIFAFSDMANKRAAEVGKENIINGTIGAFLDAQGQVIALKTVEESMRNRNFAETVSYAPLKGLPLYTEAAIDAAFGEYKPQGYTAGIATPGGTGALHNTFYNYLNEGDCCITTDYFWGNYRTMLREMNCTVETFPTFDEQDNFNLSGCMETVKRVAQKQENVMLLLNTPAHNPTGFQVSDSEWDEIIAKLTEVANAGKNNVILVLDIAYIDFAGKEGRAFLAKLGNLPKNFLVILTFSMSKGYTLYGYRMGCQIALSAYQDVIDEFVKANAASSRATWSNCNKAAMLVLEDFAKNPEKQAAFKAEQAAFCEQLAQRAAIFTKEAKEVDLRILPYQSGFFIMVPTETVEIAQAVAAELRKEDIFLVPLGKGIRVAICALPGEKIYGMAGKIKQAFAALGK